MTDSPIDFSALDPTGDDATFDARVRAIVEGTTLRGRVDVATQLSRWVAPALAAAAVIAGLAIIPLLRVASAPRAPTRDALGLPSRVAAIAHSRQSVDVAGLAAALAPEGDDAR